MNGVSVGLAAAVLILLHTYVRVERDADGTWSAVIEKEAASTDLLRTVVQQPLGVDGE